MDPFCCNDALKTTSCILFITLEIKRESKKIYKENRRKQKEEKRTNTIRTWRCCYNQEDAISQACKLYPKYLGPYEVITKRNDGYAGRKIGFAEGFINSTSSADIMKPWVLREMSHLGQMSSQRSRVGIPLSCF
ncbi:hypothetical protein EVAR_30760_1 [Eumeta japonica]|uniref:Uncharacterized protein n=1 Tax=Eumeta variegata TaxID=151549 RepID=A0A4C1V7C5_EUMVA|nr:hypothetical protein EVAR_30760_1 [Eumeta japonica]